MNHTTTIKNLAIVGVLAAITAALTATIAISSIQNAAAAQNNATDIENSGTNFKLEQKEKNNAVALQSAAIQQKHLAV
jgi:hypothetical protein